jgi:hypothetical protein
MRSAVNQASGAATQAADTGANYGAQAAGVNSQLLPFLTRELNNPQGFTQQQEAAKLGAAEGGAGGSTAGLTTEANLESARNRNSGGFSGALDEAARQKDKALAGASEGIAGQNADLQQKQQQDAAGGLGEVYGQDTAAQLKAMGLIPEDVNAEVGASKTGWLQNMNELMQTLNGAGSAAAQMKTAGFKI